MALSDLAVRQAKAIGKPYSLGDADGLSLAVSAQGGKCWHFRYYWLGKQKRMSLGTYPEVTLQAHGHRWIPGCFILFCGELVTIWYGKGDRFGEPGTDRERSARRFVWGRALGRTEKAGCTYRKAGMNKILISLRK
jgi:hypothetical protein